MAPGPAEDLSASAGAGADDTWDNGSLDDVPDGRGYHTAVWTGSVMIVWGGFIGGNSCYFLTATGSRYDPLTDRWTPTSVQGAPLGREFHTAVWTGNEMIAWGGQGDNNCYGEFLQTGGRYNPSTDTWIPTSTVGAPTARQRHTAVWTGSKMIVWGGEVLNGDLAVTTNTGGAYDPASDSWTPTSTNGAPRARLFHAAIWSGSRMIVWGGADNYFVSSWFNTGGRYDPTTNKWSATSTTNAPSPRYSHTAVWSGSRMVVWG